MSAAAAAKPLAVLRHVALLAGLLAVIAGFPGMHILSGPHGTHAQAPPAASLKSSTAPHTVGPDPSGHAAGHPAGHSGHGAAGTLSQAYDGSVAATTARSVTPAAATVGVTQVPSSCVCQGGCAETPAVHVGCTPSPAGASLSAPQPGTMLLEAQSWSAARADRLSSYAYLPGTPTPRDLSISRT